MENNEIPLDASALPELDPEQIQQTLTNMGIKGVTSESAQGIVQAYNLVRERTTMLLQIETRKIDQQIHTIMASVQDDEPAVAMYLEEHMEGIKKVVHLMAQKLFESGFQNGMIFGKNLTVQGVRDQIARAKEATQDGGLRS